MIAILEPITAGILISFFNRFLMPRFMACVTPMDVDHCESSESASINPTLRCTANKARVGLKWPTYWLDPINILSCRQRGEGRVRGPADPLQKNTKQLAHIS